MNKGRTVTIILAILFLLVGCGGATETPLPSTATSPTLPAEESPTEESAISNDEEATSTRIPAEDNPNTKPPPPNTPSPKLAYITGVEVDTSSNPISILVLGNLPNSCTRIAGYEESIDDHEITLTITTRAPANRACSASVKEFSQTYILSVELDPGEYTLIVNEDTIVSFTID